MELHTGVSIGILNANCCHREYSWLWIENSLRALDFVWKMFRSTVRIKLTTPNAMLTLVPATTRDNVEFEFKAPSTLPNNQISKFALLIGSTLCRKSSHNGHLEINARPKSFAISFNEELTD